MRRLIPAVLSCALCTGACGSDGSEEARKAFETPGSRVAQELPEGHPPLGEPETLPGSAASSVAGIAWTAPANWEAQGARSMRAATYTIRTNREGTAECAVFFFGAGQGGGVQANIDRWVGQFEPAPDAGPDAGAQIRKEERHGWPVSLVEVAGTYTASMGPAGASQPPQPGYMMLAAIVEGPQGAVFFKLTGPEAVVEDSRDEFVALMASVRPAG